MEKESMSTAEALEEAGKYSSAQHKAFLEEWETDIQNLARSMAKLYDEHAGIFLIYGVQVEVEFSVFNEVAYRQFLGCPEVYNRLSAMAKAFREAFDD